MKTHTSSFEDIPPAPHPHVMDEDERLRIVESFDPDALEDDPELKSIVEFAARLCDVPVAQVTLVEELRQRFLAGEGLDIRETPRNVSFCAHAMLTPEMLEVRDATLDPRFSDNALVTGPTAVRFYAGQRLVSEEGAPLGALCVIDAVPRPDGLSDFQKHGLAVLGQAVMRRLNARRSNIRAHREIQQREDRLAAILEGLPQIAWSADGKGNFDYFNSRWAKQIGAAPPNNTEDWKEYIHPDDRGFALDNWLDTPKKSEAFEHEFRMKFADGSYRWVLNQALPMTEQDGTAHWFGTVTDIDEMHQLLEQRNMLTRELSHRIKNIFAVMIGLATLKVRKTPEHEPFANELIAVLRALNRAHEFVQPGSSGIMQDKLQGLLAALFAPYTNDSDNPRVRVSGDDANISQQVATPLALVFHELATNSAKYGALSVDEGHVNLVIEDCGDTLALTWVEHGGPPAVGGGEDGFGSRLVEMSVKSQLGGTWERRFTERGLVVDLTIAKSSISR
ncbi:MAG: PAS domain-containing protein [Alteraurantiacibacter sp. bin_em_oilr2.035]|nr:PAS domain-containing protein [Alteraurantiacibacter sp. bin_em_oilr2.035]